MSRARRAVAALAAVALAIGLAGCSGPSAPRTSSSARADKGPLTFWVMGDSATQFEQLVAPFTERTGITVNAVPIPWDAVDQRFAAAVASHKGPDLLQIGLSKLPRQAGSGALLSLKGAVSGGALKQSNFLPGLARAATSRGGDVVSVPWIADTRVLFYRSDILEEAGIDRPPATWSELRADAKKLAARGEGQFGFSISQSDSALPVAMTWDHGGDVVTDSGRLNFDTAAFHKAAELYLGLYEDGSVPTGSDFNQRRGFVSGAAPMLVSGSYLATGIRASAPKLRGKWSVTTLPADTTNTSLLAGSNIGVWGATRHRASALKLLDFLSQPATQARLYSTSGNLPAVKAAYEQPQLKRDPLVAIYQKQLQNAKPLPLVENWDGGAGASLLRALNAIALTGADRASTLQHLYGTTSSYRVE